MHVLLMAVGSLAVGLPFLWLGRRGWFGSRKALSCAQDELRQHGRVLLAPTLAGRTLGAGPMVMDKSGLTINAWRSTRFYLWPELPEPFTLRSHKSNSRILFLQRVDNRNYGKWKLFRNTKDKFLDSRQTILSAYGMGWDNLLKLLNEARVLGMPEDVPAGLSQPLPVTDPEISARVAVPPIHPLQASHYSAIPDWAIKSGLALAVVTALGYMVSSFSWTTSNPIVAAEPITDEDLAYTSAGRDDRGPRGTHLSNINPRQHVVRGYTKLDGTYVVPHIATNPDHDKTNNLSSPNNNPHTSARGH